MRDETTRPGGRRIAGRIASLAAALPAMLAVACGGDARARHDVVLIVIDTLRADHLTQYGHERETAVALNAFAAQATRFSRCYAPAPWTTPSTATIFTGLLPTRHGSEAHGSGLSSQSVPLAERLAAAGWRTAGFSHNINVSERTGFDRGFETFQGLGGELFVPAEEITNGVIAWADDLTDAPFFLYLQPMSCHAPYEVPEHARTALLGREPDGAFRFGKGLNRAIRDGDVSVRPRVTPAYVHSLREQYDTAIRYTVDEVGRVLDLLRAKGRYDDALIIITSDHGEELFDHGGFGHAFSLHEENLHVPLFVKLPGQTEGRVVDEPVMLQDIYPTMMDVLDLATADVDGRSLRPLIEAGEAPAGWEAQPRTATVAWDRRCVGRTIVAWPYKLIRVERNYEGVVGETYLYDLSTDPRERNDVAASEPELVEQLSAEMDRRFAELERRALQPPVNTLDIKRELEAIGY